MTFKCMSDELTDENSTSGQVMAWCLMAPSHYLNQCFQSIQPPRTMSQTILCLVPDNYKFILTMLCCLCKTLTFQWSWHSFLLQTSWMKIDHPNRKPLHSGPCVLVMSKKWIMSSCARTTPLHGRHGSLTTRHGPWMLTITPTKLLLAKGHAMVLTRYAQFL